MAKTLIGATPVTDLMLVAFEDDTMGSGQHQTIVFRVSGTWCSLGTDGPDVLSYKLPPWMDGLLTKRLEERGFELKGPKKEEEPLAGGAPLFVDGLPGVMGPPR